MGTFHILLFILVVATLLIVTCCKNKKVIALILSLWVLGVAEYVHAGSSARRAMHKAKSRTTKAVIEVQGWVEDRVGTVERIEFTSKDDIASLFEVLQLRRNPVFRRRYCACMGNPHIQLYDPDGHVATITIHHGRSIRCTLWPSCNVDIRRDVAPKLKDCLSSHGIEVGD
jgi:hypothetical protein